jgi:uncharacterized repeat protein (TIGR03803 family)
MLDTHLLLCFVPPLEARMKNAFLCAAVVVLSCGFVLGQQFKVLYAFNSYGGYPRGTLVFDQSGNIYGTTPYGGDNCPLVVNEGCGTVFELSPVGGGWTYTLLYTFLGGADGAFPWGGLVIDSGGNLYGTTVQGGSEQSGTVFELSPALAPGGAWTESVIHSFCTTYGCKDGYFPYSKLLLDPSGRLYGTTSAGGDNTNCRDGCGTVFRLVPPPLEGGKWVEHVLYTFCTTPNRGFCPDGEAPMIGLIADGFGNLYGTTEYGGAKNAQGNGVLYELSHSSGAWTESVLHSFPSNGNSVGELALDAERRLYGATTFENGGVYRDDLRNGTFQGVRLNQGGTFPAGGVLVNSNQKVLYGTTTFGAGSNDWGTIFKFTSPSQQELLYTFSNCDYGSCPGGGEPGASLIQDSSGNLYGTTIYGGNPSCPGLPGFIPGCGVVFEITP